MIADVAAIFQWSLAELETMPIDELIRWRDKAVIRWNRMQGHKE